MKVKVLMRAYGSACSDGVVTREVVCTRFELREVETDTLNKRSSQTVMSFFQDEKEVAWYGMYDIVGMEFDHDYKG